MFHLPWAWQEARAEPRGFQKESPPARVAGAGSVPPCPLGLAGCFKARGFPSSKKALVLSRAIRGLGPSARRDPHTQHPGWRNVKLPWWPRR